MEYRSNSDVIEINDLVLKNKLYNLKKYFEENSLSYSIIDNLLNLKIYSEESLSLFLELISSISDSLTIKSFVIDIYNDIIVVMEKIKLLTFYNDRI